MPRLDPRWTIPLAAAALVAASWAAAADESTAARLATRSYPSIFEAWNPAQNLEKAPGDVVPLSDVETPVATLARHDLAILVWGAMGLKVSHYNALATDYTPESLEAAKKKRAELLALNPHFVVVAQLIYRSANDKSGIPLDSPWWKRDESGQRIPLPGPQQFGQQYWLDFAKPEFQEVVARQCKALIDSGAFDGCMMDWWSDHVAVEPIDPTGVHRLELIKKIRAAIGDKGLLIGNTNGRMPAWTAPYLNGMFMEGYGSNYFSDWRQAADDLIWARSHLRKPGFTMLEGWYRGSGREDLARMRAVTTLALTQSDGFALFSDPNSPTTPNHAHDWYPFWDKSLGRPTGPVGQKGPSGSFQREFQKGTAVFNPPSNGAVQIRFKETRTSAASGQSGREFEVPAGDGDLFLRPK
jgi:hypothetical protein